MAKNVRIKNNRKKGQVWSIDYAISIALFVFALLIAFKALGTKVFQDNFPELREEAEVLSEQLMSSGYPEYWTTSTVIQPGILTKNRLSKKKLNYLKELSLKTKYNYAISINYPNGTIIPVGEDCIISNLALSQTKTLIEKNLSAAFYYTDSSNLLVNATKLNFDIYTDFSSLKNELLHYDVLFMENPKLGYNPDEELLDFEKKEALEEFVSLGNDLFLIGDVGLDLFNIQPKADSGTANVTINDSYLGLEQGMNITTSSNVFSINSTNTENYLTIAKLPDNQDLIARIKYGDGYIYYFGTTDGSIPAMSISLKDQIAKIMKNSSIEKSADCVSYNIPTSNNKVVVKRIISYKGEIVELKVELWD